MKTRVAIMLTALAVPAFADDRAACVDAVGKGQNLRDAHKLVEAREQFRTCARQQCPPAIQRDCTTWLDATEKNLPSIVIIAKDPNGGSLIDVTITVDGSLLTTKLDGRAQPMNPGPHAFHFESGGEQVDQQVLVVEGIQNQPVTVVIGHKQASQTPDKSQEHQESRTTEHGGSPVGTIGWVLGAVGLGGIVIGSISGGLAIGNKNGANCDPSTKQCDAGPLTAAHTAAAVSDIGFIAGGVLLATGVVMILFAPKAGSQQGAITLVPSVAANSGGVILMGTF
jgi:hypothetical protein